MDFQLDCNHADLGELNQGRDNRDGWRNVVYARFRQVFFWAEVFLIQSLAGDSKNIVLSFIGRFNVAVLTQSRQKCSLNSLEAGEESQAAEIYLPVVLRIHVPPLSEDVLYFEGQL